MMNFEARNQYMETLRETYLKADKKEKGRILDEYCRNTGQERKYAIKKFRYKAGLKPKGSARKARKEYYNGRVKAALAKLWIIFDYPCGQRLAPLLKDESAKLRMLDEIECSEETLRKLQRITPSTIDKKLAHEKELLMNKRKYASKRNVLIAGNVPTKTSAEQDRSAPGQEQIDCVEHCGTCAAGDYVNTLSIVDIFSGWWEGEAIMGKGQERALTAIANARTRFPFAWKEIHPDNGGNILNIHVYNYAMRHGIDMSRSRPYKKNDNCFVEQKNSTHVRQVVGYLRYDALEEQTIMNSLYRNELRLYKNFFQPVMKLASKERIKGKIHKKQGKAMTPFKRLMESPAVPETTKAQLQKLYESLNPAEMKRTIDAKLSQLHHAYRKKNGLPVEAGLKMRKSSVPYGVKIYHSTDAVSVS
jgi:hypothetical protein